MLVDVSTEEESMNQKNYRAVDIEQYSYHQPSSEEDLDSSNESDIIESVYYYIAIDKITKWDKKRTKMKYQNFC